ncbi:MAG: NUDIX hydrolase [Candidatus Kerfeldbacteria bacterium]|nr:NUDIX hydrolase [Candidatus Kerfeldbacteria bacterium]
MAELKIQKITACALVFRDGKLLVAKRADTKKFLPGKFELPGGHIELGEDILEGLRREFQEEFSIAIIPGDAVYAFTYMNGDSHVVEVDFLATLADPDIVVTPKPDEHSEVRWVNRDELDQIWDPSDAEYPAILKGFERAVGK